MVMLCGSSLGSNMPLDLKIYVPLSLLDNYKKATNWVNFANQIIGY